MLVFLVAFVGIGGNGRIEWDDVVVGCGMWVGRGLTAIPLRAQICAQLFNELRASLITFPIFVRCQRLIARNDRELFSSNRGISHLNEACRIDELSRGSILGYEILTFN